jgi:Ankyrin repeat
VLNRNDDLAHVLMQLGADARVGLYPHRDVTSAYAIAVDRQYSEILATIEREEENRHARLNHEGAPTSAAVDVLRQAIAEGRTAEAIALMEADPPLIAACDISGVTPLHLAAWKHNPAFVGWLLDHGASPGAHASHSDPRCDDLPKTGKTPLDFAAIVASRPPEGRDSFFY